MNQQINISPPIEDEDYNTPPPRGQESMLYGLAGEVAKAAAEKTEVNPYAACFGFMVMLSASVGRDLYLKLGDSTHHARIFGLHVGRSGRGRKGDSMALTRKIRDKVFNLDKDKKTGNLVGLIEQPHIAGHMHAGGLSSREGLVYLIHDGYTNGKTEVPPIDDKRLFIIESEFANVLHQSKRDGNTLSAAIRDSWDGVSIKPATKSFSMGCSDPHICLLGNITPGELIDLIEKRELTNGFANRFFIYWAEKTRRVSMPPPVDDSILMTLSIKTLDVIKWAKGNYPEDKDSREMILSDDAKKVYDEIYHKLDRPVDARIDSIMDRRTTYVIRLSMLFAIMDKSLDIEPKHINAAYEWVLFSIESVKFIFSTAQDEAEYEKMKEHCEKVLAYLRTKPNGATKSEINRDVFYQKLPPELDYALNLLMNDTPPQIELIVKKRTDGKPGRKKKVYKVLRH